MTDTLFNTDGNVNLDDNKDYFEELVGEGKRYRDPKELAKSKAHADAHIEQLQAELAGLRQELKTRTAVEDFLKRGAQPVVPSTPQTDEEEEGNTATPQGIKPEDIEKLLETKLQEREKKLAEDRNFALVKDTLKQKFGPQFGQKLQEVVNKFGVTQEYVNHLAKTQPKLLLGMIGEPAQNQQGNLFAPPDNAINTAAFGNQPSNGKDWNYYEKMRKENPNEYWTPRVQNEMFQQAKLLGDRFKT